ncbi:MAG: peptidylprolyl isomerase [Alphaproteobacteria bacterium]|nr:peptidylprolyl isomerase [Alphaproteobacteria bacterium]
MFTACSKDQQNDPIVAIVNGDKVFKSTLMNFIPPNNQIQNIDPYFENLRERAINVELIHQKALLNVKADDTELAEELNRIKEGLILEQYRKKLLEKELSEKGIKEKYKKFIKENPAESEVRARHILVEKEEDAKQILEELEKGGSFEALSNAKSKDKAANAQKGDLGYFRRTDMVKPFADSAFALREKMISKLGRDHFHESTGLRDIVKTQFGWHVIEVLGSRESSHPPLEELKSQLEGEVTKDTIEKEVDRLKEKAKFEILPLPAKIEGKDAEKDPILVKIDGKEYKKSDLITLIPNSDLGTDLTPFYDRLANEFVKKQLMTHEALKSISDKDKSIQEGLNKVRKRALVNIYLERYVKSQQNDASLQQDYKAWLTKNPQEEEVHARHILVETEDEAKAILAKLKEGTDFATMANEKSKDKGAKGGDLGYFNAAMMVPEFSQLAFSLQPPQNGQKGEMGIVKSNFGWHIVEALDKRKSPVPTFDEVKPELEAEQAQKIVDDYLEALKKEAKIELFDLPKDSKDKKEDPKVKVAAPDLESADSTKKEEPKKEASK